MKLKSKIVVLALVCASAISLACPAVSAASSLKTSTLSAHSISAGACTLYTPSGLSYITVTSSTPTRLDASFKSSSYFRNGYKLQSASSSSLNPTTKNIISTNTVEASSGQTKKVKHAIKNVGTNSIQVIGGTDYYYN